MRKIFLAGIILFILTSSLWAEVSLKVNYPEISRGRTMTVKLLSDEEIEYVEGEFLTKLIHLYEIEGGYRAYVSIPLLISPGYYPLRVGYVDANENYHEFMERIQIKPGVFQSVNFNVPKKKKGLLKRPKVMDDWVHIERELAKRSPRQLWKGPFANPFNNYYVTLPFGTRETVNSQPRGQHRGLDLGSALKDQTNILAINSGKIVIAQFFDVFGGTIVVDHGQGIHSLYYHLSKIFVKPGQAIEKGGRLGKMGTTGISTGIHLHLGMSVHNRRVDPMQWLEGDI